VDRPVIIHSLAHARAALAAAVELGVPVVLASAPGAAGYAGVAWFGEVVAAAAAEHPTVSVTGVLDCADAAGHVMEAVRWCAEPSRPRLVMRFTGDEALDRPLGEMVEAAGLRLIRDLAPGLDLQGVADPLAACRAWLAGMAGNG
jgi:hypothetical protein